MVRVGGLNYSCDPLATMNNRITEIRGSDGQPIAATKTYKVAGWATTASESQGAPVWDLVAEYLRAKKSIAVDNVNSPTLKNVTDNPGISDYPGLLE